MGSLSDLTLGQIVRALGRYRPVAIAVAAILVALAVLPENEGAQLASTGEFAPRATTPTTVAPAASSASADAADAADAAGLATGAGGDVAATTVPATAFDMGPSSGGAPEPGAFASSEPGSLDTATPTTTAPTGPLRIAARAWASRTAGTPLAADGVPAGSLPVGTRVGQDDKLSFVRLEGTERVLRLAEHADGSRSTAGPAAVRACQIIEPAWVEGDAIDFDDAPTYDAGDCVEGVRAASGGTWTFDLSRFGDPTDQRGFALVPGAGAGLDFQVAFRP